MLRQNGRAGAYGRMFHALYQTPVTIVRPFMTYGPMQNEQKIIPYVTLVFTDVERPRNSPAASGKRTGFTLMTLSTDFSPRLVSPV